MKDEFDTLKKNIKSITSQEFNTAYTLVGKIINYSPDMQFCDVEVEIHNGKYAFTNVPAHGYPVKGSTGIIHFHNGHLEQPVCDCAYRLNPPQHILKEYYTNDCFNFHHNGDFAFDGEGYTAHNSSNDNKIEFVEESYTRGGNQACLLREPYDYIEFNVDLSGCTTEYFKFQCYYQGNGQLKIECHNTDTGDVIGNLPYTVSYPYKIWTSPLGRFGWAFNKEVYPYLSYDRSYTNDHVTFRITNLSTETEDLEFNNNYYDNEGNLVENDSEDNKRIIKRSYPMMIDGLLVYHECDDSNYYNSENDMIKLHDL